MHGNSSDSDYEPPAPKTPTASPKKRKVSTPKEKKAPPKDVPFPFLSLPAELIDEILFNEELHIRDHLCLAASCRALRSCYYTVPPASFASTGASFRSPIWAALLAERPFIGRGDPYWRKDDYEFVSTLGGDHPLMHLWSREDRVDPATMDVLNAGTVHTTRGGTRTPKVAVRGREWDLAAEKVATQRITKTTAKGEYKVNDTQLAQLPRKLKRNPHSRGAAPMQLFVEAAVEAIALRMHGGAAGHAVVLEKRAAAARKAAQTKRDKANGTWVSPTKKRKTSRETDSESDATPAPTPSPSKAVADAFAMLSTSTPTKNGVGASAPVTSAALPVPVAAHLPAVPPFMARLSAAIPAPASFSLGPPVLGKPASQAAHPHPHSPFSPTFAFGGGQLVDPTNPFLAQGPSAVRGSSAPPLPTADPAGAAPTAPSALHGPLPALPARGGIAAPAPSVNPFAASSAMARAPAAPPTPIPSPGPGPAEGEGADSQPSAAAEAARLSPPVVVCPAPTEPAGLGDAGERRSGRKARRSYAMYA